MRPLGVLIFAAGILLLLTADAVNGQVLAGWTFALIGGLFVRASTGSPRHQHGAHDAPATDSSTL